MRPAEMQKNIDPVLQRPYKAFIGHVKTIACRNSECVTFNLAVISFICKRLSLSAINDSLTTTNLLETYSEQ